MNSYTNNKKIVKLCKNYYKIVNTDIYEKDKSSHNIIKLYRDYIFGTKLESDSDIRKLVQIDNIMYKFVTDSRFKKEMISKLSSLRVNNGVSNLVDYVMEKLIEYFEDYKDTLTRNIYIPRWI